MADCRRSAPLPFPEIVNPGPWEIAEGPPGSGYTDFSVLKMVVPLDTSHLSEVIRAHEMAHAKWSNPKGWTTIAHPTALQIAEDIRLKYWASKRGVVTVCNCVDCLDNVIKSAPRTAELRLPGILQAEAKYLSLLSLLFDSQLPGMIRLPEGTKETIGILQRLKTPIRLAEYLTILLDLTPPGLNSPTQAKQAKVEYGDPTDGWPIPHWILPPLDRLLRKGACMRFSDSGVPVAPWQVYSIARMKRRASTASLLIDTSGSMKMTLTEIHDIIHRHPASIIATYSDGKAAIVGANGRMVSHPDPYIFGGLNTTDLPCLRWLAHQPKPRYWVSDGEANKGLLNSTDLEDRECQRECFTFALRHQIKIVPKLGHVK